MADNVHVWDGVSHTLSRILQSVDDVTFEVLDVKEHDEKKKVDILDEIQGDNTCSCYIHEGEYD